MAFPSNLDNDFKTAAELDELQQLSGYDDALHQNRNVDLTQESKDGKQVQKFFDYMALHVLIPCINALNRAVLALKGNTSTSLEALEKKLTALSGNTAASVEMLERQLTELSGNTTASMEALEALDKRVHGTEGNIELLPKAVICVSDLSEPVLAAQHALKIMVDLFPGDNNVSYHKIVFRERKTGDLYYGSIRDLMVYEDEPDGLKKIGTSSKDRDEEINNILKKQEELPIGLLSVDDLSDPATMGLLALQQAMAIFPDISENNLKKHNFVFKERKTGDFYYGTIDNLMLLSEFPDLLKKIGCSSKDYSEDVLNLKGRVETLETAETQKPVVYVEVDNIGTASAAQKILKAVKASGLVPDGAGADEIPAYVYDRNTKFLYKCTSRKAAEIYASLAIGGTPEMPEKICYLGDVVSKQYVDDLFHSIVDGNEVEY